MQPQLFYNFCLKSDGTRRAKMKGKSVFLLRICPFLQFSQQHQIALACLCTFPFVCVCGKLVLATSASSSAEPVGKVSFGCIPSPRRAMALSKANSVQSRHFHFLLGPSTAPSLYVLSGYWQRRDAVFSLDKLLSQKCDSRSLGCCCHLIPVI